jgi:hypothetical protein
MLQANGGKIDGMPYDLYAEDPDRLARDVRRATARHEALPRIGSVDKKEWHLAILRSSDRTESGAVWMDYDSVPTTGIKGHLHRDAMNLGLVAKGLDLLPEFGYPAVQFGDWHTPQARWHLKTAAHNTVVVDGQDQIGGEGQTTMWAEGQHYRVMRASPPASTTRGHYEPGGDGGHRARISTCSTCSGWWGGDHAKFTRSSFPSSPRTCA